MTARDDNRVKPARRADKAAARKVSKEAEDAAAAVIAETRHVAEEAFERIKASRARAVKKVE